ncbi:proton pump complex cytochrome B SoxC [Sulfuracidifex metallicus]|uniref:Cytochrome bc complex cytochrome b subunit n=1 Tax=Sulfuracidifex metallicus DSM 6482 = JCM 9184 TaxID=523847 RepID=A0A6A9QT62_SULME|nr:proton pump complex cytochrome B SoxC [Sulfuracidifex metallicus]MUN28963.1 cytochrome bc complex cytochrome b subunit [Sulfuracidifex metallicus DSM 6482 = JCM 9184]WOE50530.1 proton pump complex cytochrome B SoxC [Sulfuracidifex metallicus DSM 6482 = JCM 9184]
MSKESLSSRVSNWFKDRLGLDDLPLFKTPDYMFHVNEWLGALVAGAFFYTVISGLILLLYYNPEAGYDATETIINTVPYGSVFLYSHLYGSYAMIILAYIHMFRNYFTGAYKKPRELLWIFGVLMLVLTLGASFLGYSLIGDVLATSAVDVGAGIISSVPQLSFLLPILFGNYDSGDFTRVLAWHIILVALIGFLFVFHLLMAERYGMMPSRKVKPKAPAVYTKEEDQKFNPWWPRNFVYMMSLIFLTWGFIIAIPNALAYLNGLPQELDPFLNPKPAPPPSSPLAAQVTTYPPWFFLFVYKIADFTSDVVLFLLIGVIIPLVYLLLVPFIDRTDELHPLKRRVFTGIGILMITYLVQTSIWGDIQPGIQVSVAEQVLAYLPPAIIVAIGMAFLPYREKGSTRTKVPMFKKAQFSSPIAVLLFMILAMLMAGAATLFLASPSPLSAAIFLPILSLFVFYAKALTPVAIKAMPQGDSSASDSTSETINSTDVIKLERKKRIATYMIGVLLIMSAIIAADMWTIPSTGFESNMWGIDLGLLFIMLGEAISLYHYVVYKKPNESYE